MTLLIPDSLIQTKNQYAITINFRGKSIRTAASEFGLSHVTLSGMVKSPSKDYIGKGKRSKVLTIEEESNLKDRYTLGIHMYIRCLQDIIMCLGNAILTITIFL